ncbi:MAG: 3-oxoacyl-[acyl-carrier-protein] synthase 3 [Pirellulaceae bacterium]|nr:MAG: 3-oxoacyl-[acyl-carrier-protein] synthase 3 [Pirellulaceae bacterium]
MAELGLFVRIGACKFSRDNGSIALSTGTNNEPAVQVSGAAVAELSGRSRLGTLPGIRILGTGSYLPSRRVVNDELAALGCDSQWIVQRTGILERRRAAEDQATSDLAYEAAIDCLRKAGVAPRDVDLLIVATITPDHATPSTACHVQRRLGCICPAMDVNAACAGFMYAALTASQFIANGMAKRALVIGAEVMSRTVNPRDVKTFPLFGDGAGAALLGPADGDLQGWLSFTLGAEGCGGQLLCVPSGGSRHPLSSESIAAGEHYMRMEGRQVFKWAVRIVADSCRDCLIYSGKDIAEVDALILHQANIRIIDSAVADLGIDRDKVLVNLDRYGNTSAASIPIALDEAIAGGTLAPGSLALLCGFGSGLAWGTGLLQM